VHYNRSFKVMTVKPLEEGQDTFSHHLGPTQTPSSILHIMSTSVTSLPYAIAFGTCVFLYFVVYPVIVYFRDVNGTFDELSQNVTY
jgi:hypothetical protein